jgi:hypothetical protein
MNNEPVAWMDEINTFVLDTDYKQFPKSLQNGMIPLYTHPHSEESVKVKELTDEVWNKAFDFYCETDEGVLKFDLELRDEWKKEQLIRWKEALRKAQKNERK